MDISKIEAGQKLPDEINVIIEVPAGSSPVKYEFCKDSGAIFVDRFMQTPMHYPCNYGFVPHTLSGDGDPADVLVITEFPLIPGCVITARPIGVLIMEDEAGEDEKILAVPTQKQSPYHANINEYKDLPEIYLQRITHFFEHYKDLEKGKWVKVKGLEDSKKAKQLIEEAVKRYNSK